MQNTWMVVLPPIIVVTLATVTHRILFSLLMGIVSASLIVYDFSPVSAFSFAISRLWQVSELANLWTWQSFWACSNLFICAFLIILGVLMVMLYHSGASYAYGNFMIKKIKTAGSAERSSLLLSTLFFIDDYFSCLTVGSVMQPITDRFKIPRAKLAFLVNVVVAPLALIVPLTSWIAYTMGQLSNAGVSTVAQSNTLLLTDPFYLYLDTIPFLFYAVIVLASVWYMTFARISYGLIGRHEEIAQKTGELFGGKIAITHRMQELSAEKKETAQIADFLIPIAGLFIAVVGWIMCSGGWWFFGGSNTFIEALGQANIYAGLFAGSLIATICSFLFFVARKKFIMSDFVSFVKEGSGLMGGSIITLLLIWTFSSILSKDLETGKYVAGMLIGHVDSALLPVMFFGMASLIAGLMGTAWGTMGMLIPLALQMLPTFFHVATPFYLQDVPLFIPMLGAIISGSVVGTHLSPVSDVMIMSAMSAGAYHLDVLKSHINFVIPTMLSSALAFLIAGYMIVPYGLMLAALVSCFVGIIINFALLHLLQVIWVRLRK